MSSPKITSEKYEVQCEKHLTQYRVAAVAILMIPLLIGIFGILGSTEQLPNALSGIGDAGAIITMTLSAILIVVVIVARSKKQEQTASDKSINPHLTTNEKHLIESKPALDVIANEYEYTKGLLEAGTYCAIRRQRPKLDIVDTVLVICHDEQHKNERSFEIYASCEQSIFTRRSALKTTYHYTVVDDPTTASIAKPIAVVTPVALTIAASSKPSVGEIEDDYEAQQNEMQSRTYQTIARVRDDDHSITDTVLIMKDEHGNCTLEVYASGEKEALNQKKCNLQVMQRYKDVSKPSSTATTESD